MKPGERGRLFSEKIKYFFGEVISLKEGSLGYKFGFGLLLVILLPILVIELLIVLLFGKDLGLFILPKPVLPPVLVEEEVPESLRDLIPLARKFGIGDDADRDDIMGAASMEELSELVNKVVPRQQEISDWLDTFSEHEITDTAAFFLYLGSACEEVPGYRTEKKT